jgi:septum formation protein
MLQEKLRDYRIILASQSPRRQMLLAGLDLKFEIIPREVEEVFPAELKREEIVLHLCRLKADAFHESEMDDKTLILTADTIVWLNDHVLGKPSSREDAIDMLKQISGNKHVVYTGVCIKTKHKSAVFFAQSEVTFRELNEKEITWYVDNYSPMDKAGAYGIQEWIGYVGIQHIEGSYYNVMGLPTQKLYVELTKFLEN